MIKILLKRLLKTLLLQINEEIHHKEIELKRRKCTLHETSRIHKEAKIESNNANQIAIKEESHIRGHLMTFGIDGLINIGEYCYVGIDSQIWSANSITIGDRVLIAHRVFICDNNTHPIDKVDRHEHYKEILKDGIIGGKWNLDSKPIQIDSDVWIGQGSIILKGVTIGSGSVVAAGSVVTHNIPENVIVAGNPAKIIKHLHD